MSKKKRVDPALKKVEKPVTYNHENTGEDLHIKDVPKSMRGEED